MSGWTTQPGALASNGAVDRLGGPILSDEQRQTQRESATYDVWLVDVEGLTVLRCRTDNVSEGGLFAWVPIGTSLTVGQRYELHLRRVGGVTARSPAWPHHGHGTIVRTELDSANRGCGSRLGFALRYDPGDVVALA